MSNRCSECKSPLSENSFVKVCDDCRKGEFVDSFFDSPAKTKFDISDFAMCSSCDMFYPKGEIHPDTKWCSQCMEEESDYENRALRRNAD